MIVYHTRGSWHIGCDAKIIENVKRSVEQKAAKEIMSYLMEGNRTHVVKIEIREEDDFLNPDLREYYVTVRIEDISKPGEIRTPPGYKGNLP